MNRANSTKRQYCTRCKKTTTHEVTHYLDNPKQEVVSYCAECGT